MLRPGPGGRLWRDSAVSPHVTHVDLGVASSPNAKSGQPGRPIDEAGPVGELPRRTRLDRRARVSPTAPSSSRVMACGSSSSISPSASRRSNATIAICGLSPLDAEFQPFGPPPDWRPRCLGGNAEAMLKASTPLSRAGRRPALPRPHSKWFTDTINIALKSRVTRALRGRRSRLSERPGPPTLRQGRQRSPARLRLPILVPRLGVGMHGRAARRDGRMGRLSLVSPR